MAFLVVGLGVVLFIAAGLAVRARAREARLTRDTDAWVRFLHDDLSRLVVVAQSRRAA
jgi:hypothetical protein